MVALLGALFAQHSKADWLDATIDSPIIAWLGGRGDLLTWLAFPGTPLPAAALSAAIAIACLLTGRLNGAILAATAIPVAAGLCGLRLRS